MPLVNVKSKVAIVAGARPNFVKIAPVLRAIQDLNPAFEAILVHTGQHYSPELSDVFFEQLGIRKPDLNLGAGGSTHGQQTARILEAFEGWLTSVEVAPTAVIVVGDVNSTIAAALAAAKLGIKVIHLEAGLRSFDRSMPEEINRLATDAISDLLLVSEPDGEVNLAREGVASSRIRYVGNVMIDTLARHIGQARNLAPTLRTSDQPYALVTLHRPSNVDSEASLTAITDFLLDISTRLDVIFPVHPRTKGRLDAFGLGEKLQATSRLTVLPPLGYLENLAPMQRARFVMTDSGGIQEETSWIGVPCLTLRANPERPCTVTMGTTTRAGQDLAGEILDGAYKTGRSIPGWDGKAAARVAREVKAF